jgi:hypothetical protein
MPKEPTYSQKAYRVSVFEVLGALGINWQPGDSIRITQGHGVLDERRQKVEQPVEITVRTTE